jgi:cysteinyl-tRNA synthetase
MNDSRNILAVLQIFNSLTRRKEAFTPIEPGKVGIYVCGMTVYDYCHIGHARVMVVFDVIVRYLRAQGYQVKYVRNVTDIDDKIIRRARENDEPVDALTERFIRAMHEDALALGNLAPDIEPRATQSIAGITDLVQALLERGFAYRADNGDVYFEVARFDRYGELANQRLDELRAGARVEVSDGKRDPLDFVLWKAAKPGEPNWPSPWGPGRPGWHIECSAMSQSCLGNHFDIHGGGMDLKFPHHECEIAQSEAATGGTFVNYWMHNGFVQINDEKMSKSLGNFFTVREVLARYQPEVLRFLIVASHYRSPLSYSDQALGHAKASLVRLYTALRGLPTVAASVTGGYDERFVTAMNDDFNTPEALATLFDLARDINRARSRNSQEASQLGAVLRRLGGILGLLQDDPNAFLQRSDMDAASAQRMPAQEIEALVQRRNDARQDRDWAEADKIRDALAAEGVLLEDGVGGTTWRRA